MPLRTRFIVSLIAIMLLCWADVFYVGTHNVLIIPTALHQPLHFIILLVTMLIGYYNWKDYPEKWLKPLWLITYTAVVAILVIVFGFFFIKGGASTSAIAEMAGLRTVFIGPLPLLIFYILAISSRRLSIKNQR